MISSVNLECATKTPSSICSRTKWQGRNGEHDTCWKVRYLWHDSNLDKWGWAESVNMYFVNTHTNDCLGNKWICLKWDKSKSEASQEYLYAKPWYLVHSKKRKNYDAKLEICTMVGCSKESKVHCLYKPKITSIMVSLSFWKNYYIVGKDGHREINPVQVVMGISSHTCLT